MSEFALPHDLQNAIRTHYGAGGRELAAHSRTLSQNYRAKVSSRSAVTSEKDVAAYLKARVPATFAAIRAALQALQQRVPQFSPSSMLDAGAGPGTASWAALSLWPSLLRLTLLDENAAMLKAAACLKQGAASPALRAATIVEGTLGTALPETHDLVVLGYALAEVPEASWVSVLGTLWNGAAGAFVIVEPGTPEGHRRILAARGMLQQWGAAFSAPCPHQAPCPLTAPDWCHFAQRLPRSRDHMRAKGANVPFEDEKYAYLAVTRDPVRVSSRPRILARPLTERAGLRLKLCNADGSVSENLVPKRDREAFRKVSRAKWGDDADLLP